MSNIISSIMMLGKHTTVGKKEHSMKWIILKSLSRRQEPCAGTIKGHSKMCSFVTQHNATDVSS
jgi:hypothetical protein